MLEFSFMFLMTGSYKMYMDGFCDFFRKCDVCEGTASVKSTFSYVGYRVRNDYFCQFAGFLKAYWEMVLTPAGIVYVPDFS